MGVGWGIGEFVLLCQSVLYVYIAYPFCVCKGGLSFEVREFFRETSSSSVPADVTSAESACSSDVIEPLHTTTHSLTNTATTTAAAAAAYDDDDEDDDADGAAGAGGGCVSYKHASSSAPTTWIAFKVHGSIVFHSSYSRHFRPYVVNVARK